MKEELSFSDPLADAPDEIFKSNADTGAFSPKFVGATVREATFDQSSLLKQKAVEEQTVQQAAREKQKQLDDLETNFFHFLMEKYWDEFSLSIHYPSGSIHLTPNRLMTSSRAQFYQKAHDDSHKYYPLELEEEMLKKYLQAQLDIWESGGNYVSEPPYVFMIEAKIKALKSLLQSLEEKK